MADILIVDDEENIRYSLELALKRSGHSCRTAGTAMSALQECRQRGPDIALVDVQLPDMNGIELVRKLRDIAPEISPIVITAFGTVSSAVSAMKQGAEDFLQKPLSMEGVLLAIDRCLEDRRLRSQLTAYEEAQRRDVGAVRIIGDSPQMQRVMATADKIAALPDEQGTGLICVLLTGETGTGKEVIARYIHARSPRSGRPFVHVNCTAIPENLFESELFGHESGSFTDAKTPKKGLFETAHEGTLFLDEIGDMPVATQAKLLTAIESGRFRRLGGTAERLVNPRVVAATNAPLARRVKEGLFREDLYFRLAVFTIDLPPLRERDGDLLQLTHAFLERFSRKLHRPVPRMTDTTRGLMQTYPWPGNVRELANVLQRAVLLSDRDLLEPGMLGLEPQIRSSRSATAGGEFDFTGADCTLAAVETRLVQAALKHSAGNISEAARLLGITRGSLRNRLEKMRIEPPV